MEDGDLQGFAILARSAMALTLQVAAQHRRRLPPGQRQDLLYSILRSRDSTRSRRQWRAHRSCTHVPGVQPRSHRRRVVRWRSAGCILLTIEPDSTPVTPTKLFYGQRPRRAIRYDKVTHMGVCLQGLSVPGAQRGPPARSPSCLTAPGSAHHRKRMRLG